MLAAFLASTSQVSVMTFFSGTLSVFLAYLYTCFLLFEEREAVLPLEAFIQGLVTR